MGNIDVGTVTALNKVKGICAKLSNGLHPDPETSEAEWAQWLTVFKMPYIEICPECGGRVVDKTGKYGEFRGCSRYPACKYTYTEDF